MALLDQYGSPLVVPKQNGPQMDATIFGDRPALTNISSLVGLNPYAVGAMLAAASRGNSSQWQAFCELIEERDAHYLCVLNTRKFAITQLPITVLENDAEPEHADFVRQWLGKEVLQPALYDMADALAKGFSVLEIEWHCKMGDYYPSNLLYRPQRWFEVSYQDGETIFMRDNAVSATPDVVAAIPEIARRALDPDYCLIHKHKSWSGLTIRQGLTRAVAFNVLFKLFTIRDWGVFVQGFGIPYRIGKYGAGATKDDREVLWQAVTNIAGVAGCIIPESMKLEFVEPKNGAGANTTHENRAKYLDEQTSKAVLGQTGTTDTKSGAHASGAIHRLVQEDIERADAAQISATVNRQLVRKMIDFSFGAPKNGQYPLIKIGRPDETPIEFVLDAIQKASPQGFKVKADDLYSRLNLTPPKAGDAVVGITAQPQIPQPSKILPPQDKPGKINAAHIPETTQNTPGAGEQPNEITLHSAVANLAARHMPTSPEIIEVLKQKIAKEAFDGLKQMTDAVRAEMMQANSLEDLQDRLDKLHLPDDEFQEAMQRGIFLAELTGEAAMLESMKNA